MGACCILLCMLLLSGCMNPNIREDEIRSDLPALDPQAGVAKNIDVTCYYQLLREPYLYGMTRAVEVHANERAEHAIVNMLLEGAQAFGGLNGLFPAGTSIVDITMDDGILYVTLSKEFMDESALRRTLNELENAWEQKRYTQTEYDALVQKAEQSALADRRLALYSLVNTLTGYNDDMRVLLLVDKSGTGVGERLSPAVLGMEEQSGEPGEPMPFVQDVVKAEDDLVPMALSHIQAGDYAAAYALFADENGDNTPKPEIDEFERAMRALGSLQSFTVNSYMRDADGELLYASADIAFIDGGNENVRRGCHLTVRKQGALYMLDYASCIAALGGQ
ncbi:MAG: GerMN domain-containing protein [Eubacteriales bacterium]|nr:GerMN domain-containing protein [Eubacteriales bacterium]